MNSMLFYKQVWLGKMSQNLNNSTEFKDDADVCRNREVAKIGEYKESASAYLYNFERHGQVSLTLRGKA